MSDSLGPAIDQLAAQLRGRPIVTLAGAGISTESGIPDYRGHGRSPRRSIQFRDFVDSPAARARYWARSARGWRHVAAARPNAGHRALAALEAAGRLVGVITQNVDGLHHAAGSREVVELHGALARVRCLACGHLEPRARVQTRIEAANPALAVAPAPGGSPASTPPAPGAAPATPAPDGDADLADAELAGFTVPACEACGGVLKPDVVLFGENVPPPTVARAWELLGRAGALLVVGSSLAVFSGYRFAVRAAERGLPIAIVNLGPTRADARAAVKLEAPLGQVLPRLAAALS